MTLAFSECGYIETAQLLHCNPLQEQGKRERTIIIIVLLSGKVISPEDND